MLEPYAAGRPWLVSGWQSRQPGSPSRDITIRRLPCCLFPIVLRAGAMTVILLVLRAYGSVAVITGTRRVIRAMMLS